MKCLSAQQPTSTHAISKNDTCLTTAVQLLRHIQITDFFFPSFQLVSFSLQRHEESREIRLAKPAGLERLERPASRKQKRDRSDLPEFLRVMLPAPHMSIYPKVPDNEFASCGGQHEVKNVVRNLGDP